MSLIETVWNNLTASLPTHDTRPLEECIDALKRYMGSNEVLYYEYTFDDLTDVEEGEVSFIHWLLKVLGKLISENRNISSEERMFFESLQNQHVKISKHLCKKGPRLLKKGMLHIYWLILNWDDQAGKRLNIRSQLEKFVTVGDLTEIACTHRLILNLDVPKPSSNVVAHDHCLWAIKSNDYGSALGLGKEVDRNLELWILDQFTQRYNRDSVGNPFEIAEWIRPGTDQAVSAHPVINYLKAGEHELTGPNIVQQMCHLACNWRDIEDAKFRLASEKLGITDGASFAHFLHENYFCPPSSLEFESRLPADSEQMQRHIKCWLEGEDRSRSKECPHGFSYL